VDGFIPATRLSWTSNLDGPLGTTGDIFARLSAGTHIVTLSALDSAGLTGTASVTVIVLTGSDYPSVTIVSPHDYDGYRSGGVVETLIGSATDPVDATLPDSAFVWTDSIDGALGTGKTINVVLSNSFGIEYYHVITLTVTNSAGHKSTSQVTVLVGEIA
jgi:hypothetical protein